MALERPLLPSLKLKLPDEETATKALGRAHAFHRGNSRAPWFTPEARAQEADKALAAIEGLDAISRALA